MKISKRKYFVKAYSKKIYNMLDSLMKRKIQAIFLLIILVFTVSCNKKSGSRILINYDDTENNKKTSQNLKSDKETINTLNKSLVLIPQKYTLFSVVTIDLNNDKKEEQVLIVKDKDLLKSNIYLLIVEYDEIIKDYMITSILKTNSTLTQNFDFTLQNLTDDENLEIIYKGLTEDGESALTIFKQSNKNNKTPLKFYPIFSSTVKGEFDIEQIDEQDKTVFFIVESKENEKKTSIINTPYKWSKKKEKFIKSSTYYSENNINDKKELLKVIGKTTDDFKNLINGTWKLSKSKNSSMLLINKSSNVFEFFNNNSIESYTWLSTRARLFNRFQLIGRNDCIKFITVMVDITVNSKNSITVNVFDMNTTRANYSLNSEISGEYTRVDENTVFKEKNINDTLTIEGIYTADNQSSYTFSKNKVQIKNSKKVKEGFYTISKIKDLKIMTLSFFDSSKGVTQEQEFLISFTEKKSKTKINRLLTLTPGDLTSSGFKKSEKEIIKMEQIEEVRK